MSPHNEQVQPTPFEVAQTTRAQPMAPDGPRRAGTPPWVLPALGVLLLLAVLVVFWLPQRVNPELAEAGVDQQSGAAAPVQPEAQPSPPAAGLADATPWSDAQLAKLRKEAQDVRAELLEIQFALEERGVKQWAPNMFAAAADLATAGDELYRTRDFPEARARYEESLVLLETLQASIPEELATRLEQAAQALEQGDLDLAISALDLADVIEPGNAQSAALRQRLEVMPQVLDLLARATAAEQEGDLAAATALLKQAVALDPSHQRSASELQRVIAADQERRFNEAMSEGYAALDANQFDQARKAFGRASGIRSGSSEVASALQEVEVAATAHRLARLKARGLGYEQKEQWQQAVDAYEQAQKIDSSVLFAREGLARSLGRARLDKQFRAAIDEPQRLADVAVAEATERLLAQARKINPRGPLLNDQIDRLQVLLKQANTPVTVTLRSDGATDVTVYKVARLGRFDERELSLRPGDYTAVGSRNGYRDVRVSFTIRHDSSPAPLTIACTETI